MTWSNSHTLLKSTHTQIATSTILVTGTLLLIFLGVATTMSGSNQILHTIAFAQVEDREELREDLRTALVEDELHAGKNQNQSDAASPNGIALKIDRSHYIPLSPLSDSPGNQVKMLLDYSVQNPSALLGDKVNAVMEVYAANQTLLRTSSLPEPIALDDSEGSIQLATTFDDPTLQNVTVRALLTDGQKIHPLSEPIEESIGLGEVRVEGASSELK
jgi:hypothetical protein